MDLDTSITYLKGVGPQRAKLFESKGVRTVEDLLYYMPFRYEDRSNLKAIRDVAPGETATVIGEVVAAAGFGSRKSKARIFELRIRDASGGVLPAKWFRGDYLSQIFEPGQTVALYGKVEWNS